MINVMRDQDATDETYQCVICKGTFKGWGNNPFPVREDGRCCDDCNQNVVVKARLSGFTQPLTDF